MPILEAHAIVRIDRDLFRLCVGQGVGGSTRVFSDCRDAGAVREQEPCKEEERIGIFVRYFARTYALFEIKSTIDL